MRLDHITQGDALDILEGMPEGSADCCVTSPPYWALRSYLPKDDPEKHKELGQDKDPKEYIAKLVDVFRQVRRVLRKDGTLWLNIGDSYAGSWGAQGRSGQVAMYDRSGIAARQIAAAQHRQSRTGSTSGVKAKNLIGIPWMLAFALRDDGWFLRSDIVWAKPNPMPESVRDRPTRSHEYLFLLSKSSKYHYDYDAVREPCESKKSDMKKMAEGKARIGGKTIGNEDMLCAASSRTRVGTNRSVGRTDGRNMRDVWWISPRGCKDAHFATFPYELVEPCVKAGSRPKGIVLDPFMGAGTVAVVAKKLGRYYVGSELNPAYVEMAERRIERECGLLI